MSGPLERVAALFVAPEAGLVAPADASAAPAPGCGGPQVQWRPPVEEWSSTSAVEAPAGVDGTVVDDSPARVARGRALDAAVLGTGAGATAVGAALAGELRARGRAKTALLLVWAPACLTPVPMPAWPAARELAAALAESHDVAPRGRLVQVQLPHHATAAAAAATSLSAATGVPTVLALCGPRSVAFDSLIRTRDIVVVLESDESPDSLTEVAAVQLGRLNDHVVIERTIRSSGRRRLASWGLGRARHLGRRMDETLA